MRRLPLKQQNHAVHREHDYHAIRYLALLLICGILLASGFVFAAGRHFKALQYGYERETLRIERARLLEEQHRLLLAREEADSPRRLEGAARQIGLQPIRPSQVNKVKFLESGASRPPGR